MCFYIIFNFICFLKPVILKVYLFVVYKYHENKTSIESDALMKAEENSVRRMYINIERGNEWIVG